VLAVLPFGMTLLLTWIDRTWLEPLTTNFVGYMILAAALTLWLLGIIWSRKILAVDI
jgi:Flp pilus assembly protein TadB